VKLLGRRHFKGRRAQFARSTLDSANDDRQGSENTLLTHVTQGRGTG
jgi:hypothetical protein